MHDHHVAQYRRVFWVMLVLAVPTVLTLGHVAMVVELRWAPGLGWVSPVLGTVMYVWGGRPFLAGAVDELAGPHARDDAAHRAGDHGRLRGVAGARAWACWTTSSTSGGNWRS